MLEGGSIKSKLKKIFKCTEKAGNKFLKPAIIATAPFIGIAVSAKSKNPEDDEIKNLKYQTKRHDHENILKSPKIDNEYYKKKYKSLNKKKVLLTITEILIGSGSAISTSATSLINPSVGIVLTISTALLTSIAVLITNEYITKLKLR